MKAWIVEAQRPVQLRPLRFVRVGEPEPGDGQVLIRVHACGICRTDIHVAEGDLPMVTRPTIPGHQVVGSVVRVGAGVTGVRPGELVGVAWIGHTCGVCRSCAGGSENYCPEFRGTGWHLPGGYAEYLAANGDFVFPLAGIPLPDEELAPLMCPGVTGYAALRMAGIGLGPGDRLGLFGFGPTAYYVLRVARHRGMEVFVSTRSSRNQVRAVRLGAAWAGDALQAPIPSPLDAAILFAPSGAVVEPALAAVRPGGTVVSAAISMPGFAMGDYRAHFWGRDFRTVYNVRRQEALEFLDLARTTDMSMPVEVITPEQVPEAMISIARGESAELSTVIRWAAHP